MRQHLCLVFSGYTYTTLLKKRYHDIQTKAIGTRHNWIRLSNTHPSTVPASEWRPHFSRLFFSIADEDDATDSSKGSRDFLYKNTENINGELSKKRRSFIPDEGKTESLTVADKTPEASEDPRPDKEDKNDVEDAHESDSSAEHNSGDDESSEDEEESHESGKSYRQRVFSSFTPWYQLNLYLNVSAAFPSWVRSAKYA